MARVRLTPKVHVRHLTLCFQSTSKEVILIRYMSHSLQKIKTTSVLKRGVTTSGIKTFLPWLYVKRILDGVFWDIISKMSFKMYSSINFHELIYSRYHHHNKYMKYSHRPQNSSCPFGVSSPRSLATTDLISLL